MIEVALRSQLINNSELAALVPNIYVGDTPSSFSYPFIRLVGTGENPDDYTLKNRLLETVAIDIFAAHNPNAGIYGYDLLSDVSDVIRKQFDVFSPARWLDSNYSYDVQYAEYRGYAIRKNSSVFDAQKPITLTLTYNIIS
jgi:hypothetical protein